MKKIPMTVGKSHVTPVNNEGFSFCLRGFHRYFDVGTETRLKLVVSKTPCSESYKVVSDGPDNDAVWLFDEDDVDTGNNSDSPWPYDFDTYLTENFSRSKPLYVSVELDG